MKNIRSIYNTVYIICFLSFFISSCTKDMEGLNEDKKLISDKMLEADANEGGYTLPGMQLGIVDVLTTWRIEMQQTLNADLYGGYFGLPASFYDNRNNATYAMVSSWNDQIWLVPSSKVLDQWVMMKKKGFDTKYPDLYAMALIFKVFAGHRLTDIFGPIPYSLYGTTSDVRFDSEEEAYNLFFEELRTAVASLKEMEQSNPAADQARYAKFDKSRYGGDYAVWIKVANTLRLRLAIRIAYVNPEKAKIEAEAAINDGGVLEGSNVSFEMTTGTVHPLLTITRDWGEARLNASVESFLKGYKDPRLPVYALPATDPALGGEIKGMRTGAAFTDKNYLPFSQLNFATNPFVKLMDVSESYFLRAEGALRGWDMGGSAKDFYEEGIRVSFAANKVSGADAYIQDNTSVPAPYVDPYNPANNAAAASSIKIKWDESVDFEEKLERIITQKWIAIFPDGQESWSEFRRTGYPGLWPVVVNFSNGEVPNGEFIKRINYPPSITNASQTAVAEAVSKYLDGADKLSTPIWWDVN
ncbi:MAG: SusD/RagB family nutrient-binding outer membrane lipoprotein [Chitinophagaceae bacterium]|nr:SusD/RagB family nutrient-binding outer membrane lipoprotein [Chitinophagaceae bacterium]MCW5926446.1 SusD/RagB family nutrient-binding outer membrane lipoprotein [Chitinophagaceae bacterium]